MITWKFLVNLLTSWKVGGSSMGGTSVTTTSTGTYALSYRRNIILAQHSTQLSGISCSYSTNIDINWFSWTCIRGTETCAKYYNDSKIYCLHCYFSYSSTQIDSLVHNFYFELTLKVSKLGMALDFSKCIGLQNLNVYQVSRAYPWAILDCESTKVAMVTCSSTNNLQFGHR